MAPTLGPLFLGTPQLTELARFYDEIVGLPVRSREPGHHVWYDAGIDFALHAPRNAPGPDFTPRERGAFAWFRVDADLAAIAERLRADKHPVWGPYDGGERRLLVTLDPDENAVGLYAPTEARASQ